MKTAIIGTGISGLAIAYLFNPHHEITVYEKNDYIGGHSRTITVNTQEQKIPVDTGFIVFNHRNYPNLTSLFNHLNVPTAKSDMSFGVSINQGKIEYSTSNLNTLFGQRRNLFRRSFWNMLLDILKFNQHAISYLQRDSCISLRDFLNEIQLGKWFQDYYLVPMAGAIWSTSISKMLDFPAKTLIRFFENHGLLTVSDQPQWYTVKGGSKEYVNRLTNSFFSKIKLNCGVKKVIRKESYVEVYDTQDNLNCFDQVIFACHPDQTLSLLENPTKEEQQIMSCFQYQQNKIAVHSDLTFMPKRKKAWASWVYLSNELKQQEKKMSLSYWMNHLQPLQTKTPIIATLNATSQPNSEKIYDNYTFEHPVFNQLAIEAQEKISSIQSKNRISYVGAWQRYGFHEDGLLSAIHLAKYFQISIPWK